MNKLSSKTDADTLDTLFGSKLRVKVLKFLFRNYPGDFTVGELARRIQESYGLTKKEVESLVRLKLLKKS